MKSYKYSKTYIPPYMSKKDKIKQSREIKKSRKLYKKKKYYNRQKIKTFKSKISPHIIKAKKIYNVKSITNNKKLAKSTKCSIKGLKKILEKGRGAYYSSGSRPSQTTQSWARARLASAITGGPASKIDYHILKKYCKKSSKALKNAIIPKKYI